MHNEQNAPHICTYKSSHQAHECIAKWSCTSCRLPDAHIRGRNKWRECVALFIFCLYINKRVRARASLGWWWENHSSSMYATAIHIRLGERSTAMAMQLNASVHEYRMLHDNSAICLARHVLNAGTRSVHRRKNRPKAICIDGMLVSQR